MKSITFSLSLFLLFIFADTLAAQADMSPDEMAIQSIIRNMQDAWAAKDSERFASFFADDHDFIVWFGLYFPNSDRTENARNHEGIFTTIYKNWDVELRVDKMRFLRPDLALVHILGAGRDKGLAVPAVPGVIQTVLMEKKETGWQIVSFHNLDIEYDNILRKPEPTEEEKLAYAKAHFKGWYR